MALCRESSKEKLALTLSFFCTIIMALTGIGIGLYTHSDAILFDGIFSFISMSMTGMTLFTAHLIARPDDKKFQFGYSHLEPLIAVINALVILLICAVAFYRGVASFYEEGHHIQINVAFAYTLFSTIFSFTIFGIERKIARNTHSELVDIDSQEWLVDGVLSSTLLIGFITVIGLDYFGYSQWNTYIDGILVSFLAVFIALLPLSVLRRNVKEVLLIAPKNKTYQRLEKNLAHIANKHQFADYSCHFAKTGRQYDLEINILVTEQHKWPLEKQDNIREIIHDKLVKPLGDTWLSISFTSNKKWL